MLGKIGTNVPLIHDLVELQQHELFGRLYCLRDGLFKDLIVSGLDCHRTRLSQGWIVIGTDFAWTDCVGSESVGPDFAGQDRTCPSYSCLLLYC